MLLAEWIFTRKIKSVLNKILPEWKAWTSRNISINEYLNLGEKVFFKMCQKGKEFWKDGVVKKKKRIGHMTYMVQGPRWEYKHHLNQLRHRHANLESPRQEIPMEVLYDTFDIPMLQEIIEPWWYAKQKRTMAEFLNVEPILKR